MARFGPGKTSPSRSRAGDFPRTRGPTICPLRRNSASSDTSWKLLAALAQCYRGKIGFDKLPMIPVRMADLIMCAGGLGEWMNRDEKRLKRFGTWFVNSRGKGSDRVASCSAPGNGGGLRIDDVVSRRVAAPFWRASANAEPSQGDQVVRMASQQGQGRDHTSRGDAIRPDSGLQQGRSCCDGSMSSKLRPADLESLVQVRVTAPPSKVGGASPRVTWL
jgi:hypothetical protein